MATRSAIGYLTETETVVGVYCHWDGYVKGGVGQMLHENYNSESKIQELLALGYISSLCESIDATEAERVHKNYTPNKFPDIEDFEDFYSNVDYYYIYDSVEEVWKYKRAGDEYYHRLTEVFGVFAEAY
jgi:hypothetical protein